MADNHSGATKSVDLDLQSTLESVDSAEAQVLQIAEDVGFEEEDLHKIGMAVRESMVNAVVHGNQYSKDKKVHVTISANSDRMTIKIADQGKGFDLNQLPDPLAEENLLRNSGRGIFLIRAFMDDFQVRRLEPVG